MSHESSANGILQTLRAALVKRKPTSSTEAPACIKSIPDETNVEVTPGEGHSRLQFLAVKNTAKEAVFHATAQIVSSQNTNSVLTGVYIMGWGHTRDAWATIPKGESRQILVATITEVYVGSLFHLALIQSGPSMERHWARWNAQDNSPLPRFGLKVSITAEGRKEAWEGFFSVTPDNQTGTGVCLTFRGRQGSIDTC
jgi:hypothetical protein